MGCFKLEIYVDILQVLAQKGPLKLAQIMDTKNISCNILKEYVGFLIKQGLVEERIFGKNRVFYSNTDCGITVLEFFSELDKTLTVIEERGYETRDLSFSSIESGGL
jgi:predicted transcriptional regulator